MLADGNDDSVRLWDVQNMPQELYKDIQVGFWIAFSPDGHTLASSSNDPNSMVMGCAKMAPASESKEHTGWVLSRCVLRMVGSSNWQQDLSSILECARRNISSNVTRLRTVGLLLLAPQWSSP